MRITTIQGVRAQIERMYPGLTPFTLKADALDEIVDAWGETQDIRYLRRLQQQAALAEAINEVRRGEDASYLSKRKGWPINGKPKKRRGGNYMLDASELQKQPTEAGG